jgi:O-antigen ligase
VINGESLLSLVRTLAAHPVLPPAEALPANDEGFRAVLADLARADGSSHADTLRAVSAELRVPLHELAGRAQFVLVCLLLPASGTHYEVLGVAPDATAREIRKRWVALIRRYHPDHVGGAAGVSSWLDAQAHRLIEAYQTLKDPARRRAYDAQTAREVATGRRGSAHRRRRVRDVCAMSQLHARPPRPASSIRWPDRMVEAGALFLLVFTPLAYGTVEPWSEAIAEVVVLGMLLVWVLGMLRDWELRIELPPGWLPAYLFLVLVFLQAAPLPSALVGLVSPRTFALHQTAAAYVGGSSLLMPLSLAPHSTFREAVKLGAVAAFFLACYNTCRTRPQILRAIWTMAIMGALVSVFGIVQRVTWNGRLYWVGPEGYGSAFSLGPFVNRAHFAGLVIVVVPMALALLLAGRRDHGSRNAPRGWVDRLRRWAATAAGPMRLVPFLIMLMGGAALVSGSRGGLVALITSLLVMAALTGGGRTGAWRARRVTLVLLLIALTGAWIGGDVLYGTVGRLLEELGRPEQPGGRLRLWADAVHLFLAAPMMGTGYASFGVTFPEERTLPAALTFTHAESDWMELLTDTGALGSGLALAVTGCTGFALLRRARAASSSSARMLAVGAAVALLGAVVHGIGNFTLPVMSNLLYLAVALSAGLSGARGAPLPAAPRGAGAERTR